MLTSASSWLFFFYLNLLIWSRCWSGQWLHYSTELQWIIRCLWRFPCLCIFYFFSSLSTHEQFMLTFTSHPEVILHSCHHLWQQDIPFSTSWWYHWDTNMNLTTHNLAITCKFRLSIIPLPHISPYRLPLLFAKMPWFLHLTLHERAPIYMLTITWWNKIYPRFSEATLEIVPINRVNFYLFKEGPFKKKKSPWLIKEIVFVQNTKTNLCQVSWILCFRHWHPFKTEQESWNGPHGCPLIVQFVGWLLKKTCFSLFCSFFLGTSNF